MGERKISRVNDRELWIKALLTIAVGKKSRKVTVLQNMSYMSCCAGIFVTTRNSSSVFGEPNLII